MRLLLCGVLVAVLTGCGDGGSWADDIDGCVEVAALQLGIRTAPPDMQEGIFINATYNCERLAGVLIHQECELAAFKPMYEHLLSGGGFEIGMDYVRSQNWCPPADV